MKTIKKIHLKEVNELSNRRMKDIVGGNPYEGTITYCSAFCLNGRPVEGPCNGVCGEFNGTGVYCNGVPIRGQQCGPDDVLPPPPPVEEAD